ncbi:dihydroxyacetone kinase subunit DhaK [Pullulanibacillus sp. KACC 23026]|uniref:dihydroxyacetone kinase subunit DhaK n=1 Tax=Pullulanibacillus sp. KACC 23026 TaxID=3028315 RepID=UPI0023AF0ED1|nr:dihydroxyacetone kinase subunit DhaK [Pullulanibacillus sp. KACC 23026]WEG14715.1 dihydroxyacetone kinase subunit DhaK [Pullulanibacillus sp. KACC 23026]
MKKVINDPNGVVDDMLNGILKAYPNRYKRLEGTTVLARKDAPVDGKVALVSGGGSGHEPSHAGFVGKGMLDAAVSGEVFTSPTPDQVYEAIKAVDSGAGVLLVIKNYTGDVMNFEMAAEMAEAEGIKVAKVVVNDDVAVEDSTYTTGRRGIAGTVFVHKLAGAKAERGGKLDEVEAVANKVIENVRSMGIALTPCTIPAAGQPGFVIGDNEMEIGMGIHGEPGTERTTIQSSKAIADLLVEKTSAELDLDANSKVAVLINGLGATPLMELYILNNDVSDALKEKGVAVYRTFVGEYMTSMEMTGLSLTLLKLDDELMELLEDETEAIGW